MFRKLLIANRGEIACRIIRTAKRMGLHCIAVYSDADRNALHVRCADEARRLGPGAASESYLAIARIIEAARAAGAEAIHPGYGFLAENAQFARACAEAGMVFVGPSPAAIEAMGSKAAAKDLMQRAAVPVLAGYHETDQSMAALSRAALTIGLPVIVKPSLGGGGKGMQVVEHETELAAALASAQRLARSAFGNDDLVIERYLPAPRHIEVQVLADAVGKCFVIFDRDCSVQRRHQKLIEEAPALDIAAPLRARLHAAALAAARTIDYRGAGTVEFLLQGDEFFFLEMNTRLQVEHPVTELISGLDLVEWQLRIAGGEEFEHALLRDAPSGHAIEVRICAEDPDQQFTPSSGQLLRLDWPASDERLRIDTGFVAGDAVPDLYDSLLAKVIVHGVDREDARARMVAALEQVRLAGVRNNIDWLRHALQDATFRDQLPTTRFVADLAVQSIAPVPSQLLAAAAAWLCEIARVASPAAISPWQLADGFRLNAAAVQRRSFVLAGARCDCEVAFQPDGAWLVEQGAARHHVRLRESGGQVTIDDVSLRFDATLSDDWLDLWAGAAHFGARLYDPHRADAVHSAQEDRLVALLPGTVVQILVAAGEHVRAGQELMIIEAMKMEHAVRAPHPGVVMVIHFAVGQRVNEGVRLIELANEA